MDLNPRIPAALASEDPMEYSEAARIVCLLYAYCLKRNPGAAELESWVDIVLRGTPISEIIERFGSCDEYQSKNSVAPFSLPAIIILQS
jgi:hypothetical protein